MVVVYIPAQCRDLSGGIAQVEVEARVLADVVRALESRFPGIAARLTEGNELADGVAASIDGLIATRGLSATLRPDSEVHFLPAIGGG